MLVLVLQTFFIKISLLQVCLFDYKKIYLGNGNVKSYKDLNVDGIITANIPTITWQTFQISRTIFQVIICSSSRDIFKTVLQFHRREFIHFQLLQCPKYCHSLAILLQFYYFSDFCTFSREVPQRVERYGSTSI